MNHIGWKNPVAFGGAHRSFEVTATHMHTASQAGELMKCFPSMWVPCVYFIMSHCLKMQKYCSRCLKTENTKLVGFAWKWKKLKNNLQKAFLF